MLVPSDRHDEAVALAREAAGSMRVGDPKSDGTDLGPVATKAQFAKVQSLIEMGIGEGAVLAAGGPGRPDGLDVGFYVRPTVFAGVRPEMTIAREEVFGPVLAIMPYQSEAEAIRIANGTPYGLAAHVQGTELDHARRVAVQLHAGTVYINHPPWDAGIPFGGYKQSGNGREYGEYGFESFLEIKGVAGYDPAE
jgi:aldehyde dehydrogenase (NAD+)